MNHRNKSIQILALTLTLVCGTATTSQAGIIPWVYDAIFGPPGVPFGAGYRGGYGANYGAYYNPYAYGYGWGANYGYANQCCNTCNSTVTNYAPADGCCTVACAGNNCSGTTNSQSTTSNRQPTPADTPKKTLSEESPGDAASDDGFRERTNNSNENGSTLPKTDAFKIPETEGDAIDTVIPKRESAPTSTDIEEETTDEPGAGNSTISTLGLDTAMTTHPVTLRDRTEYHARFVSPTIARRVRAVDVEWKPTLTETKIAGR